MLYYISQFTYIFLSLMRPSSVRFTRIPVNSQTASRKPHHVTLNIWNRPYGHIITDYSLKRTNLYNTHFSSNTKFINYMQLTNNKTHPILFPLKNNVNFDSFYNNINQYFMTIERIWDIHYNITWFYLCNMGNCYILSILL